MSHSIDETYAIYNETRRKARKAHVCMACREPIAAGHFYWHIGLIFEGKAETVKRCERCQAIHVHLRYLGDETWPDERLNCGEEYSHHWGREPPPEATVRDLPFEELLARSSLGTPGAVAIRNRANPKTVAQILARADELDVARRTIREVEKEARAAASVDDAVDLIVAEYVIEVARRMRAERKAGDT